MKRLLICSVALMLTGCGFLNAKEPVDSNDSPTSSSTSPAVEDCQRFMQVSSIASGPNALPDISVECLQGHDQVMLATLRGPMVMPVWASWCQPCAEEMPLMQQFHDRYGDQVSVLSLAIQDVEWEAIAGANNWGVTLPSLEDPDGKYMSALNVIAPPTTLFIDRSGHVVYRHIGAVKDMQELKQLVSEHLGVKL